MRKTSKQMVALFTVSAVMAGTVGMPLRVYAEEEPEKAEES